MLSLYLCTWFGETPGYMYVVAESKKRATHQMSIHFDMYGIEPEDTVIGMISGKVLVDTCP